MDVDGCEGTTTTEYWGKGVEYLLQAMCDGCSTYRDALLNWLCAMCSRSPGLLLPTSTSQSVKGATALSAGLSWHGNDSPTDGTSVMDMVVAASQQ